VQITLLLGGTVLVERIFSYEGIGNMAIDAVINRDFPLIQGDEARLRQVIDNLLSNAIKYSPKGGPIVVHGRYDDRSVTLAVEDHGIGLPHDEQDRIFQRFYRVDSTLTRTTQGTGLGLYLSRAIVEAHGGRMMVESTAGVGSTFSFRLPRTLDRAL